MKVETSDLIKAAVAGGAIAGFGACAGVIYGASSLVLETSLIFSITALASEKIRQDYDAYYKYFETYVEYTDPEDIASEAGARIAYGVEHLAKVSGFVSGLWACAFVISHLALGIFTYSTVVLTAGALSIFSAFTLNIAYAFTFRIKNAFTTS